MIIHHGFSSSSIARAFKSSPHLQHPNSSKATLYHCNHNSSCSNDVSQSTNECSFTASTMLIIIRRTTTTTLTSTIVGSTSTIYSRYTPAAAKEKRAAPTLPPYVSAFAASQVSKACSCLSIPASTTTVSTTVGTTLPANVSSPSLPSSSPTKMTSTNIPSFIQTITATVTGAAQTVTVTDTTTVTTTSSTTTTLPALCAPSVLSKNSGVLGTSGNGFPGQSVKAGATTITSCCAACFNTQGCLSYYLYQGQCQVFTSVSQANPNQANAAQQALCPLGLNQNDSIFPDGASSPAEGDGAFHIGPCVRDATPLI